MNNAKQIIKNIPGVYPLYRLFKTGVRSASNTFLQEYSAGHFYSPVPDLSDVLAKENILFNQNGKSCPGIDLHEEDQFETLTKLTRYEELPFTERPMGSSRFYFQNDYFSYGDAIVLYAMLRYLHPKHVVEVGSGFSSALMLDTNDRFLGRRTQFVFIEPYPEERLLELLNEKDKETCKVLQMPVQDVELELFDTLEANDILFIDSSHVVKIGSDVQHILSKILPRLKPGVYVHFHDVFWPFEYTKNWIMSGRCWNEAYFLRAFLQ
jgi:Methyltransferase domain